MMRFLQTKRDLRAVLLFLLLNVIGIGQGLSFDFSAECSTGQLLYYNIIDSNRHYVGLTFPGPDYWPYHGYDKPVGDIVLPESVVYDGITYTVTVIGRSAFDGCSGLTGSLVIPSTVTTIERSAFAQCSGLVGTLNLTNSITSIGDAAFFGCSGFTGNLVLPCNLTALNTSVFSGCIGLTGTLNIPNSVTIIGGRAFENCSGFTGSLTIPELVTEIGFDAFSGCSGFTGTLSIPSTTTELQEEAFCGCSGFEQIIVANGNPKYDSRDNCNAVIETSINFLMVGCKNTVIPNSVTYIGNKAFYGCRSLETISIPNSVISIGQNAFDGTGWYEQQSDGILYLDDWCLGYKGEKPTGTLSLNSNTRGIAIDAFYGCNGLTGSLVIPSKVVSIGVFAFSGCNGFTGTLTLPNTVAEIGYAAFSGCSGFTGPLIIPSSMTAIAMNAFENCSGFSSLTIPNSITSIGNESFNGCSGFTGDLTIPSSVTTIGWNAFDNCSGFSGCLIIPSSMTIIDEATFKDCSGFSSIIIPNSVQKICRSAFSGCSGLSGDLVLPSSLNSIGASAFNNCSSLSGDLVMPYSLTLIGSEAFGGCAKITSLSIPNPRTDIGHRAFRNCSSLKELSVNSKYFWDDVWEGCGALTTIVIGDSVERIQEQLFSGFGNLTTVYLGESIKTIGKEAFANNPRLNMVYYNVKKDLDAAIDVFKNCPNLTTIHIGPDVEEIGSNIFKGCNTVHFVVALGPTPAILDAGAFSDIVDNSMLMVSCGNRVTYYSVWNMFPFNNIIEDCNVYPVESSVLGQGGSISLSQDEAQMGEEVRLTIMPNSGMYLTSLKVYNSSDPTQIIPVSLVGKTTSTYSFTMPPFGVAVVATFASGTSVSENTLKVPASIYPNPTSDRVTIEAENLRHVTIFNMQGQMVYESRATGNSFEYDFTRHVSGVYLIRVETADGVASKRVVVTK